MGRWWTKSDILNTTARNKNYIEELSGKLIQYYKDQNKKIRRNDEIQCKYCYYINTARIGGSAITTTNCRNCNEEMVFGNTCTDLFCGECGTELNLCSHCGAKLD